MPVPAHTRSHRPAPDRGEVSLPWWAVALPAVAFAALLLLIVAPDRAHAASADPAIGQLLGRIMELRSR